MFKEFFHNDTELVDIQQRSNVDDSECLCQTRTIIHTSQEIVDRYNNVIYLYRPKGRHEQMFQIIKTTHCER
jgi:hypothetical protein